MKVSTVNGQRRYQIELAPGFTAETSSLDALLTFLLKYGGFND